MKNLILTLAFLISIVGMNAQEPKNVYISKQITLNLNEVTDLGKLTWSYQKDNGPIIIYSGHYVSHGEIILTVSTNYSNKVPLIYQLVCPIKKEIYLTSTSTTKYYFKILDIYQTKIKLVIIEKIY